MQYGVLTGIINELVNVQQDGTLNHSQTLCICLRRTAHKVGLHVRDYEQD